MIEKTVKELPKWSIESKWGSAIGGRSTGFHAIPDALVRGQSRLGLNATEMVVLLNILMHWWKADDLPHPRPSVIARRMGIGIRTVQRAIESLEEKRLIQRLPPEKGAKGPIIRRFDLNSLVEAVQELATELRNSDVAQ